MTMAKLSTLLILQLVPNKKIGRQALQNKPVGSEQLLRLNLRRFRQKERISGVLGDYVEKQNGFYSYQFFILSTVQTNVSHTRSIGEVICAGLPAQATARR